jgi:UDP-3-O-[3-hydroxymyristoyl] N-acetylglucosamine deacetylase
MALHSGVPCAITLRRDEGPVRFATPRGAARITELSVVRTDRGVAVEHARTGLRIDLVEHLFAALTAFGVREGLLLEVEGPELPLLDGGSETFARALSSLSLEKSPPCLRVTRSARYETLGAEYRFEPTADAALAVDVEFDGVGAQHAAWDGSSRDFMERIAPARTFGFSDEAAALRASGRAAHVDPAAVMVLARDGRVEAGRPALEAELARHKLLDLMGDLYLYGGMPIGSVRARRPGHAASHAAAAWALRAGVLERLDGATLEHR